MEVVRQDMDIAVLNLLKNNSFYFIYVALDLDYFQGEPFFLFICTYTLRNALELEPFVALSFEILIDLLSRNKLARASISFHWYCSHWYY